jgi:5'-nucleotidase
MTREDPLHILLTNDDGIYADGLWALYDAIHSRHNVVVVAPDRERSAVGHGITLQHPIRAAQITVPGGSKGWSVSGTPADCVKLAIGELLETRPDLVISGINPGANVGVNLNYSGTVAAAREAALYGIAAMAVSVQVHDRPVYDLATRCVARLVPLLSANGLAPGIFLNINVPAAPPDKTVGICLTRQGRAMVEEVFEKRQDPRKHPYYWQGSASPMLHRQRDSDGAVLDDNCISITPVHCDMTAHTALEKLRQWDLDMALDADGRGVS